jgi:hypothetical protein
MFRSGDPSKINRIWESQSWRFKWVSGLILITALCTALFFLVESQVDDGVPSDMALRVTIWGIVGTWTLVTWAWVWRRAKGAEGKRKHPWVPFCCTAPRQRVRHEGAPQCNPNRASTRMSRLPVPSRRRRGELRQRTVW